MISNDHRDFKGSQRFTKDHENNESFIYLSFFFYNSDLKGSPIPLVFKFILTPFWVIWQFRAAIQLQFDFHRAIYNLGTVLVCFSTDLTLHEVQFLDLCTKCQHEINCVDSMG
jgi:hypothetical protein